MTSKPTTTSVFLSGQNHGITGKVLKNGKEKCSFIWTIENFSIFYYDMKYPESIKSPTFSPTNRSKYQWDVHLFPFGNHQANFVGLALYSPSVTTARCCLSFRDAKHCEFDRFVFDYKYNMTLGYYQSLSNLYSSALLKKIGIDDVLEIKVDIVCVVKDDISTYPDEEKFDKLIKPNKLIEDLSAMFLEQKLTDVVITVQGTEIKAHRAILTARSSVLAKLMQFKNSITIDDVEPEIMQKLLLFIYTNRLKSHSSIEVKKLIETAETYGVEDLKDLCGEFLSDRFRSEDVVNTLDYADSHNMSLLKSKALKFIYKNRQFFTSAEKYRSLLKKPQLLAEILASWAIN